MPISFLSSCVPSLFVTPPSPVFLPPSLLLQVHYGDEDVVLSPEQVTATLLTYLKKTAEKALGKPVADCVISVSQTREEIGRHQTLNAHNFLCYAIPGITQTTVFQFNVNFCLYDLS